MRELLVWLEASPSPIGVLAAGDDKAMAFAYLPHWFGAAEAGGRAHPLSLSLPLQEAPFEDAVTRAFFGNLLQENDQLERVIAREGLDRDDIAGILAHVGADCAGAVSVLPRDAPPVKRPGVLATDYDPLDDADFNDLVKRLAEGRAMPDGLRDPSPVAGFRRKMSLALLPDGRFALPKVGTGAPTTHIVKIPDPDHRHEARDEAFVTALAAACGLSVGQCWDVDVEGQDVLLIQRFDRITQDGAVYRLHQEDFAQAAGLPAELKYERRGREGRRFDAAAIGRILAATDRPALAREAFVRMTLFNLLIGNNDNHAKNHALLYGKDGAPSLAPFYDLVPVLTVAGFREDLAFRLGAAERGDAVGADDLYAFAAAIGIPATGAKTIVKAAARELVSALESLSTDFPPALHSLDAHIGVVAAQLNDALALGQSLRTRDAAITHGGGWGTS